MKTKKNNWLIIACLLCVFLLQATGQETTDNKPEQPAQAVSEPSDLNPDPNEYFEQFEFSPSLFIVGVDNDLEIRMFRRPPHPESELNYGMLALQLELINFNTGRSAYIMYDLEDLNMFSYEEVSASSPRPFDLLEQLSSGDYEIFGSLVDPSDPANWENPLEFFKMENLVLKVRKPLFEKPVISAYMDPKEVWPGWSGNLGVSVTATFTNAETVEVAKELIPKITLYRKYENGRSMVSEKTIGFYPDMNKLNVWGYVDFPLNSSSLIAGDYEVEIDFNPYPDYEGLNVCKVIEFEVPETLESESSKLVHTGYGLYEKPEIGNQDTFDLEIDYWNTNSQPSLFLLPSHIEIGSPNWESYRISLPYNGSYGVLEGKLTVEGITLSNVAQGEYHLVVITAYRQPYVQTSITVFEGKTEINPDLAGIEVAAPPRKVAYKDGDKLDLTGMTVRALYDITRGRMETGYTTVPVEGSVLTTENESITVTYTENGITKSTSVPVTVHGTDNWTVHQFKDDYDDHDALIVIRPNTGNHIMTGSCKPLHGVVVDVSLPVITVQSGYSGIIRFENVVLDDLYTTGIFMYIESGANVILDLVGTNILKPSLYGIEVQEGAVLAIESESNGSLDIKSYISGLSSYTSGIKIGCNKPGGVLMIGGNAIVNISADCGINLGISWGPGLYAVNPSPPSYAELIINGNAEVNVDGEYGAGIGGRTNNGVGYTNGTVIIEENAKVKAYSLYSAAIGGGSGDHSGGWGGNITIGGNAQVKATSNSTAIGGGRGGYNGKGGWGGTISIKDNAFVTAKGGINQSNGIGGGPHYMTRGSNDSEIFITGGTVNASSLASGSGLKFSSGSITGGSIYVGKGYDLNDGVKFIVQDEKGNYLNNVRLRLGDYYEVETGKNLVWDEDKFTDEIQSGVAYARLPLYPSKNYSVEVLNVECTFEPKSINVPSNYNGSAYIITLNLETPTATTWTAANNSSNWDDPNNWSKGKPGENTIVTISGNVPKFPVLEKSVSVAEIYFEPGAQIKGQHYLTAKAFVQYDFSNPESRNRWNMLAMPLEEAYPGDFTFGGYPLTWVRTFTTKAEGAITKGEWVTARGVKQPFTAGDGFVLWLNPDTEVGKGLHLLNGIHELPFFHHQANGSPDKGKYDKIYPTHKYDGTGESTFHNPNDFEDYYPVGRSEDAWQLAGAEVSKTLDFGDNSEEEVNFALVGNPFMAGLKLDKLSEKNEDVIKDSYHVWTKIGDNERYINFTSFGSTDLEIEDPIIAPLQGFIIEKKGTSNQIMLAFEEEMTTVEKPIGLRSSGGNENKLAIVARNPVAGVRTFIAKREGGQDSFGDRDARKIFNTINDVPEVYTLKPYKGGSIATAANVINSDELLIPIGLATGYAGNITLSITGMDSYDAKLYLLDTETKKEIDLTGLASYDYTVNYTPKKVNSQTVACEDRFFIRIAKIVTGLEATASEKVNVFAANGKIQVISSATNPLVEVSVFNLQGTLLYKEPSVATISHTINRNLPAGVYVVRVVSEKGIDNVKIVTSDK